MNTINGNGRPRVALATVTQAETPTPVLCGDDRLLARVRAALPMPERLMPVGSWPQFRHLLPDASCAIVVAPWLREGEMLLELSLTRLRCPLQPLIVVTTRDADNIRALNAVQVDEVVWTSELERELPMAVSHARAHALLRGLARDFQRAAHLPVKLRQALACACVGNGGIHSLQELAATVGRDRRTLWRLWREAFGPEFPLRPKDFLDWLLLLRAAGLKLPGRGWTAVAERLHVHEDTLARAAQRLLGCRLRELEADGVSRIRDAFAQHILPLLLLPLPSNRSQQGRVAAS